METIRTNEAALWQRGRSGDEAAIGTLFDLHRDRVFRHSYRLLRDPTDAEDATGVAFLELWRRRDVVRMVEGSVLPWLLVTATNAARNLRRSRARYQSLLNALPRAEYQRSAEDEAIVDVVEDNRLAEVLGQLSANDLRLVTLVLLEGYLPVEAAPVLGISVGAARTRLHRARAKLREALGHTTFDKYQSSLGDYS
jgi:RNA polymerase sigma factor (sigma-70 family)